MYVCIYVSIHICIYIHIYTYINIHLHTQVIKALMVLGRDVYRRALWPAPLLALLGTATLYARHWRQEPLSVPWVNTLQRCGHALAIWTAANTLTAIALRRAARPGAAAAAAKPEACWLSRLCCVVCTAFLPADGLRGSGSCHDYF